MESMGDDYELKALWLLATLGERRKAKVDICRCCLLISGSKELPLRRVGNLMYGLVLVYKRECLASWRDAHVCRQMMRQMAPVTVKRDTVKTVKILRDDPRFDITQGLVERVESLQEEHLDVMSESQGWDGCEVGFVFDADGAVEEVVGGGGERGEGSQAVTVGTVRRERDGGDHDVPLALEFGNFNLLDDLDFSQVMCELEECNTVEAKGSVATTAKVVGDAGSSRKRPRRVVVDDVVSISLEEIRLTGENYVSTCTKRRVTKDAAAFNLKLFLGRTEFSTDLLHYGEVLDLEVERGRQRARSNSTSRSRSRSRTNSVSSIEQARNAPVGSQSPLPIPNLSFSNSFSNSCSYHNDALISINLDTVSPQLQLSMGLQFPRRFQNLEFGTRREAVLVFQHLLMEATRGKVRVWQSGLFKEIVIETKTKTKTNTNTNTNTYT